MHMYEVGAHMKFHATFKRCATAAAAAAASLNCHHQMQLQQIHVTLQIPENGADTAHLDGLHKPFMVGWLQVTCDL